MLCLYTLYAYESSAKSWDREGGGVKVQLIYDEETTGPLEVLLSVTVINLLLINY